MKETVNNILNQRHFLAQLEERGSPSLPICLNKMEKNTAPALPPAPTMPATEPVTFGLRYGTIPNVDPSAL